MGTLCEMVLTYDWRQGGFVAADAILIEIEAVMSDCAKIDATKPMAVPMLDARIWKPA